MQPKSKPMSALLVFLAGVSYGTMAPIIKLAYAQGFTWHQTAMGQATFGTLLFLVAFLVQRIRGVRWQPLSVKRALKLIGTGAATGTTCILYSAALSYLPVAVALTLLFQFTWIGIVIQIIVTRRPPNVYEVLAALVVVCGTVAASGLLSQNEILAYDMRGILCAFGSAISCALFMFFSSRVEVALPPMQRGFIICCGSFVLIAFFAPTFFIDGTVFVEAPYGFMQGLCALLLPVLLFGLGGPALPSGMITILAASELPTSVIISSIVIAEEVDGIQAVGVVLILLGVVISQIPTLKLQKAKTQS